MTYGCCNRKPLRNPHWCGRAPIPFVMSPNCEYTKSALGQADKKCTSCKHKQETTPSGLVAVVIAAPEPAEWQPMAECPVGRSVQLLGVGGVPTSGRYTRGSQDHWQGWAEFPVPARMPE